MKTAQQLEPSMMETSMQKSWLFVSACTFLAAVSIPTTLISAVSVVVGIYVGRTENPKGPTFRGYADQGRLAGLFYYAWIDTRENFGVYRCGALTESGKFALSPM
jgi:hypothetical protein